MAKTAEEEDQPDGIEDIGDMRLSIGRSVWGGGEGMKRTKEWWSRLTREERSRLVMLERASNQTMLPSGYCPDDCGECPACSSPAPGDGLCNYCLEELIELHRKADGELEGVRA